MHKQEITTTIISHIIIGVIVLGIIVLVGFMIQPAKIVAKNRDSERLIALTNLETSINLYLADDNNFDELKTGLIYDSKEGMAIISGKGWLPLNLRSVTGGVSISDLPLDPLNNSEYYFQIGVNVANKTYEINCRFEDPQMVEKYGTDGGNSLDWYEIGTDLQILR